MKIILLTIVWLNLSCTYVNIDRNIFYDHPLSEKNHFTLLYDETSQADFPAATKRCLNKNLRQSFQKHFLDSEQFRQDMFPWLEPGKAPQNPQQLQTLFQQQEHIKKAFNHLNISHIVFVTSQKNSTQSDQSMACSNFGCFGLISWDKQHKVSIQIWDIQKTYKQQGITIQGSAIIEASGTSYVPAVVIPLPFIASVDSSVCQNTVRQLKKLL